MSKKALIIIVLSLFFPTVILAGGHKLPQQKQEQAPISYLNCMGFYFGLHSGASFINRVQLKTGFEIGGQLGYCFDQHFRTELAFTYLRHEGNTFSGNLNTYALMINTIYDFHLTPNIIPFIGVGLGLGHLSVNRENPDNRSRFAYQAIAGIGYAISTNTMLSFRYRFTGTTGGIDDNINVYYNILEAVFNYFL